MMPRASRLAFLSLAAVCLAGCADAGRHDYPLAPVPFNRVTLADDFWRPRLQTQIEVTVPHALKQTEPAVENLRRCGNLLNGRGGEKPFPHRFVSSDLYKVMEGAAYLLMIRRDPDLETRLDEIIRIIADAQQDDGYLYVAHISGVANPREMGKTPYSYVVHSHELYNMGHMYEGAVAYYRATGKDAWLKVAEKSARHIHKVFFEGDPNYNGGRPVRQAPGHEEIELALAELHRVTGERLYLDLAKKFLDVRGVTYRPDGRRGRPHCGPLGIPPRSPSERETGRPDRTSPPGRKGLSIPQTALSSPQRRTTLGDAVCRSTAESNRSHETLSDSRRGVGRASVGRVRGWGGRGPSPSTARRRRHRRG
jgi:hypothetical protein